MLKFLFILSCAKLCLGWTLPPVQFLSEFVKETGRTHVSISVPFDIQSMSRYFKQLTRSVISLKSLETILKEETFQGT